MAIEAKNNLEFAIERASARNGYRNLNIAVVTGLVGVLASGTVFTRNTPLNLFLTLAFVIFAYSNFDAILRLGELRASLLQMLSTERKAIRASLAPALPWRHIARHRVLNILVLAAIWSESWPRGDRDG